MARGATCSAIRLASLLSAVAVLAACTGGSPGPSVSLEVATPTAEPSQTPAGDATTRPTSAPSGDSDTSSAPGPVTAHDDTPPPSSAPLPGAQRRTGAPVTVTSARAGAQRQPGAGGRGGPGAGSGTAGGESGTSQGVAKTTPAKDPRCDFMISTWRHLQDVANDAKDWAGKVDTPSVKQAAEDTARRDQQIADQAHATLVTMGCLPA